MKISLGIHGGLAATLRMAAPARELDASSLTPADAAELTRLVAAARAMTPPPTGRRMPDAMAYSITIEDDDGTDTLVQSDTAMTQTFAALLDWLRSRLEI